jgi:hypothetical protein
MSDRLEPDAYSGGPVIDTPDVIAVPLHNEESNSTERRTKQICHASLVVKSDPQAGVELANFGWVRTWHGCSLRG